MKFTDALDRNLEEIQRPPNLPAGHYTWQIKKPPEKSEFESKKTGKTFERLDFTLSCVEASDDVDPDELEAFGNVTGALNNKSFLFSTDEEDSQAFERSMFNLKRFFEHLGLDEGLSIGEAIAQCVGAQCLGQLSHRPDPEDPEVVYAEVGRTAAL